MHLSLVWTYWYLSSLGWLRSGDCVLKTCLAVVALACLAPPNLAFAAQDARVKAPQAPARTYAQWIRGPNTLELIWPGYALMAHMNGHVVLDCAINDKGKLKPCAVVEETPKAQGFAQAVLDDLEPTKMRPSTVDGAPVQDPHVQITYDFLGPTGRIRYVWRSR
jgi:TonB family protein